MWSANERKVKSETLKEREKTWKRNHKEKKEKKRNTKRRKEERVNKLLQWRMHKYNKNEWCRIGNGEMKKRKQNDTEYKERIWKEEEKWEEHYNRRKIK